MPATMNPPPGNSLARWLLGLICMLAIVTTIVILLATGFILYREQHWLPASAIATAADKTARNQAAFFYGTIGTELAPLPVVKVLPTMFSDRFRPLTSDPGWDWLRQFGFIPASHPGVPAALRDQLVPGLPVGFAVSHYRPKSGLPSPVPFVGLACATCHTSVIRPKDGSAEHLVIGTGNTSLNLFAWIDAFQASLMDENLTLEQIVEAYQKENPPLSTEDKAMIAVWLTGTRDKLHEDVEKYDEPFGDKRCMTAEAVPTGPVRTQPFRTLIRNEVHRPGATMKVYTKIAAIFWQNLENGWGQFDGGIHGLPRRSSGAALAAGATVQNMNLPEIADNIEWASAYLEDLETPRFDRIFPGKVDRTKLDAGKSLYMTHCDRCHGHPEPASVTGAGTGTSRHDFEWQTKQADRFGKIVSLEEIGTDPERVTFRYYEKLPDVLSEIFPPGHRFDFPRDQLRPYPPDSKERGYINKPIPFAFARAPYLHNASVLTLKGLINLEDRMPVFYRGENLYDPDAVGLLAPSEPSPPGLYFRFDTNLQGNSNHGHDYPWPRDQVRGNHERETELAALLEYLKTF